MLLAKKKTTKTKKMVSRKPTLVLDMDETLIGTLVTHSPTEEVKAKCDMVHWAGFFGTGYFLWKRPGLDAFLRTMAPIYNVVLYTGAAPIHAKFVMERIDPHRESIVRVMDSRFTEVNHSSSETSQLKDLAKVRRNLKRIVWVDDTPDMYPEHQQVHGISVPRFIVRMHEGHLVMDEGDNVLPQLTPFLAALAKLRDFREAIAAYKAGKCEVIDGQIAIDGQIVDTHAYEEDDDDDEEDLAEKEKDLAEKERLRDLEEEGRERKRRRQVEEEEQREEARKKAEQDGKQAEIDASLWKQIIDRYEAENLISAPEKKRAIDYISKKFRCDEADKILLPFIVPEQLKEVGSQLPSDSMYAALHELFNGLKGPPFDYDTRKWLLDVLAKVTVDFFYYGKPVKVKGRTEVISTIAETQIPMFGDHADTLVFFEPIPMHATLNFLRDNELLDVELPASFQEWGKFAMEGWWQHFVPLEFDEFWERHGGRLEDMIDTSLFTDCPKLRRLYGFTSEIVSGKQQICKCGEAISSRDDFFTSEECKFLVCTDDGTVLFRLKFEDGTVVKCAICVEKLASPNTTKLEQLCKGDDDDLFLCFQICEEDTYHSYRRQPSFVKIRLSTSEVFSGQHLGMLNTKVESNMWLRGTMLVHRVLQFLAD